MKEILQTPLTVVHVIACLFLMLVVLLQPGKSGGLGAITGAAAQQVFGGRGAGNVLTKATWVTATIFFLTSITLAYMSSSIDESLQERAASIQKRSKDAVPPSAPADKGDTQPMIPAPEPAEKDIGDLVEGETGEGETSDKPAEGAAKPAEGEKPDDN